MRARGKRRATKLGAYALMVGLAIAVFWPVDHWRLYDDLWRPLALTQAENYCSGRAVSEQGYAQDAKVDPACYEKAGMENETPSISNSVAWACQGINAGDPSFPVDDCVATVEAMDLWFLLDGGYTWEWSEARPRPSEVVVEPTDPRGAGSRGDFGEEYAETTTTTESENSD